MGLGQENTPQERQQHASEIRHLNLHDVCSLCAPVAPYLPLEGQTEEGLQENLLGAAQGPCKKAEARYRGGWGRSHDKY